MAVRKSERAEPTDTTITIKKKLQKQEEEKKKMLTNPWKEFLITADDTNVLANDQILGDLGQGFYAITALSAAAADSTISINDGVANVVDLAPIPVRAAAVTFPEVKKNEDRRWIVRYVGRGAAPVINVLDGTNAEIALVVEYLGTSIR